MFKQLVLAACLIGTMQAEESHNVGLMHRFEHDELLAKIYLEVDLSECPRIVMQQIAQDYIAWHADIEGEIITKEDAMYVARLSYLFGEVFISYQYGN